MNIIESAIYQALLPYRSSTIWLAISGGVDSMVLLHAAHHVHDGNLKIIHIDHQLNPESNSWADFVSEEGEKFHLHTVSCKVNCTKAEASARNARYQCILQHVDHRDIIVTAHHLNDQYETFIHRAFRGSSLKGLLGIPAQSDLQGRVLLRPLLNIDQKTILHYAQQHQIAHIDDPSNLDRRYKRNEIRHALSYLTQKAPFSVTLEHLTAQSELLDYYIDQFYSDALIKPNILNLQLIKTHPERMQLEIIHRFVREHMGALPQRQIQDIYQSMCHSCPNQYPQHVINRLWIQRYRNAMYIIPVVEGYDRIVSSNELINLGDCGEINNPARLPLSIEMLGDEKSKYKKHLQNYGIPNWLRVFIPYISYQDRTFIVLSETATRLGLSWNSPDHWMVKKYEKRD